MAYNNDRSNDTIEFRLEEHIGDVVTYQTGWTKEINLVSWNGAPAKYDIRDWNPEHERMTKGITLLEPEARRLGELLTEYFARADRLSA